MPKPEGEEKRLYWKVVPDERIESYITRMRGRHHQLRRDLRRRLSQLRPGHTIMIDYERAGMDKKESISLRMTMYNYVATNKLPFVVEHDAVNGYIRIKPAEGGTHVSTDVELRRGQRGSATGRSHKN